MNSRNLMLIVLVIVAGPLTLMLYLRGQAATMPASAPSASQPVEPSVKKPPAPATASTAPAKTKAGETKSPTVTQVKSAETPWPVKKRPVHEVVLGSTDKKTGFKFQVQLTSLGAAVKTIKLTDYFDTVSDKRRYDREKDYQAYLKAVADDPKLKGFYTLLRPVSVGDRKFYPLATRRITITYDEKPIKLILSDSRWLAGEVQTEKNKKGKIQSQSVTFSARICRDKEPFLLLKKTYTLRTGSYSIDVRLEAENLRKVEKVKFSLTQFLATGLSKEDTRSDMRMLAYGQYAEGEVKVETDSARDVGKMPLGLDNAKDLGKSDAAEPVLWAGQTNKFFAALTYIIPKESGKLTAPAAQAAFFGAALEETSKSKTSLVGMNLGPYELKPGGSTGVHLDLFAGPKKRNLFDDTPLYRNLDYKATLKADTCCTFCTFQPLTLGMMWLLDFFHDFVTFRNYGLAIMLLVILVRICLHP
ncbi:MAG: YidC/Oxa1 family insertase periplasmic-domain containing protein, partial [Phycisphaerae bacterium]|nr:YidC/Oxa1 family insertase periplasmic-domain containing protein [Phycisphaerae bacterium]